MANLHFERDAHRISPEFPAGRDRKVSFHSATYTSKGESTSFSVSVLVDCDVNEWISAVKEKGGIGAMDDAGVYRFIPWPCAVLEVRDGT